MKSTLLFWIILPLGFFGLSAQSATPITLSEAIGMALKNNYQIQIAEKQLEIAENNNTLQNTGRYPVVDFNLAWGNSTTYNNNPASFIPEQTILNSGLTPNLDGRWTIFDGFTFRIQKDRLEELQLQSETQVKVAVEQTLRAVMLAYYQAAVQKKQLDVLEQVIDLSRSRMEYQKIKQEFAQAGTFDILQSQDAYLNDSTTLLVQRNTYETTLLNLKLAMGIDQPDALYEPGEELQMPAQKYAFQDLEEKMYEANPNIQQRYIAEQLARLNTDLQETTQKYPTISLNSGLSSTLAGLWQSGQNPFTQEEFGGNLSGNANFYANIALSYRIYDAGTRKRNIQNARMEEEIARTNTQELKRSLSNQLRTTLANYHNQLELLQLTEQLIAISAQNLEVAEERFKGSLINSFDYRSVQLAYINASQSRLNAIFNLKTTEIELIRLTGGLVR